MPVLPLGFPMCTVALFVVFSCKIEKLCLPISPTYVLYAKNCVAYVHFNTVVSQLWNKLKETKIPKASGKRH
jgi:hypothetical protein